MKKIIFFTFFFTPLFLSAQQELNEKIIGGCNFIEVEITDRTLRLKGKSLSVLYRCKSEGLHILNEENKKFRFESYAQILDYFEKRGWDFFMHSPEFVPDTVKTIWIMRRR